MWIWAQDRRLWKIDLQDSVFFALNFVRTYAVERSKPTPLAPLIRGGSLGVYRAPYQGGSLGVYRAPYQGGSSAIHRRTIPFPTPDESPMNRD